MTPDKKETYPIGFSLDTGSTTQLTIGETKIPIMPMVHIYSTHGYLLTFNLLNLQPTYVDICSPPRPVADRSGAHLFTELSVASKTAMQTPPTYQSSIQQKPQEIFKSASGDQGNLTFVIPENSTSTPAKPSFGMSGQQKPLFGAVTNQPPAAATSLFGTKPGNAFGSIAQPAKPPAFSTPTFGGTSTPTFGSPPISATANVIAPKPAPVQQVKTSEPPKPIVTVDPNYTPTNSK